MVDVVLFPSVLGVRPGIIDAAARLTAAGYGVRIFDLWEGDVYDDYPPAMERAATLDHGATVDRCLAETVDLTGDPVLVGWSLGGALAEGVALRRACTGTVLFASAASLQWFGDAPWPETTPVQIHYGVDDPFREEDELSAFMGQVRLSGARLEHFDYDISGHLFTDASLPVEYDEASATLAWERVLAFLAAL